MNAARLGAPGKAGKAIGENRTLRAEGTTCPVGNGLGRLRGLKRMQNKAKQGTSTDALNYR